MVQNEDDDNRINTNIKTNKIDLCIMQNKY